MPAGLKWLFPALLAIVFVVGAVFFAVAVTDRDDVTSGARDRDAVLAAGDEFLRRFMHFTPAMVAEDGTLPEYETAVKEVITDKFTESFDDALEVPQQMAAAGQYREAEVYAVGVQSFDDDSAVVIAAGVFDSGYQDPESGERGAHDRFPYRFVIDLVKVGDDWLVDDYSTLGGRE